MCGQGAAAGWLVVMAAFILSFSYLQFNFEALKVTQFRISFCLVDGLNRWLNCLQVQDTLFAWLCKIIFITNKYLMEVKHILSLFFLFFLNIYYLLVFYSVNSFNSLRSSLILVANIQTFVWDGSNRTCLSISHSFNMFLNFEIFIKYSISWK